MPIAIISDTHSEKEKMQAVIEILKERKASLVFHCGDWTDPFVLNYFLKNSLSVEGVLGNCDTDLLNYTNWIQKHSTNLNSKIILQANFLTTQYLEKKIAIAHGNDENFLKELINSGKYAWVLSGHTHQLHFEKIKQTYWVNPGSIVGTYGRIERKKDKSSLILFEEKSGKEKWEIIVF